MQALLELGADEPDNRVFVRTSAATALFYFTAASTGLFDKVPCSAWRPNGRNVLIINPPNYFISRRNVDARTIALTETAVIAIERYLNLCPPRYPDALLIRCKNERSAISHWDFPECLERSCRYLRVPMISLGEIRSLGLFFLDHANLPNGLFEYIAGLGRSYLPPGSYTYESPPSDAVMLAALEGALPHAKTWRQLVSGRKDKAASSSGVLAILRSVDRCWPRTRQAKRSDTPNFFMTRSTQTRRRAGLTRFPLQPLSR